MPVDERYAMFALPFTNRDRDEVSGRANSVTVSPASIFSDAA